MSYTIPNNCVHCGVCLPQCPTGAIQIDGNEEYWVEPALCNHCEDEKSNPLCVSSCPDHLPLPLPAKKGRYKAQPKALTNYSLFPNGKTNPIATSMVIWEACNILAKGSAVSWKTDQNNQIYYQREVKQGKGKIEFWLTNDLLNEAPDPLISGEETEIIEAMDIRAACIHLIFAACVMALEHPWEEEFAIDNQQLEKYLGLDKRKDLSKATKLTLIKSLVQQPCKLITAIDWPRQGKIESFSVPKDRIWHLVGSDNHFQEDSQGYKHLVGMTFRIKAGAWAAYFLNKQGYKKSVAFYQYGTLPRFMLSTVMTIWHQHEGTVRMMLWLLFKTKMGREQRITTQKLMSVAYGEDKLKEATFEREVRKRLIRKFENDLQSLNELGIKPVFDPVTYPRNIQPLWAKLAEIPDDAEEAMEFWINDGCNDTRLTDAAPRGKWDLLMKARILKFELPPVWDEQLSHWEKKKQQKTRSQNRNSKVSSLSAEQISTARKRLGISQRKLAQQLNKSQSWIRDLENGRFSAKLNDCIKLQKILQIDQR